MKKWIKGAIFGSSCIALLFTVFITTHSGAFDYESYNKAKATQVSKELQAAMTRLVENTNVQMKHLNPVPKPTFKVERVQPEANGTYQIGFIDHGPIKVNDMWTKDLKPNENQTLWNEVTVYSGVLRDNPDQGVINEWVVNMGESNHWNIPGSTGGFVTIESIQGDVIRYKTAHGNGTLNTKTGKFS